MGRVLGPQPGPPAVGLELHGLLNHLALGVLGVPGVLGAQGVQGALRQVVGGAPRPEVLQEGWCCSVCEGVSGMT